MVDNLSDGEANRGDDSSLAQAEGNRDYEAEDDELSDDAPDLLFRLSSQNAMEHIDQRSR